MYNPFPLGRTEFDPLLIVSQISFLQCIYYIMMGIFLAIASFWYALTLSMDQLFDFRAQTLSTERGIITLCSQLIIAVVLGLFLFPVVVERARKCLDFAATIFLMHLFACCIYAGWPLYWEFWTVHTISVILTSAIGEFRCMKREMQDIPLVEKPAKKKAKKERADEDAEELKVLLPNDSGSDGVRTQS